jgi:hypothetical protein
VVVVGTIVQTSCARAVVEGPRFLNLRIDWDFYDSSIPLTGSDVAATSILELSPPLLLDRKVIYFLRERRLVY